MIDCDFCWESVFMGNGLCSNILQSTLFQVSLVKLEPSFRLNIYKHHFFVILSYKITQLLYFRAYSFLPGLVCKRSRSDVAVEDTCSSCAEEFSSMVIESVLQVCSWMLPPLLRLWWPNWWPWWPLEWLLLPLLCRDIPKPLLPFLHDWNLTITKPITTVTRNRAVPTPANIVNAVVWFPDEWWPFSAIFLVPSWTCSCFAMSSGMLDNGINSPLSLSTCVPSAERKLSSAWNKM